MRINSVNDLAAAVRGRRAELGLSQADLARASGVSRKWVGEFEAGKPSAELGLVLRVLEHLGMGLETGAATGASAAAGHVDLDALLEGLRDDG